MTPTAAPPASSARAPLRPVKLGRFGVRMQRRDDGCLLLTPTTALGPYYDTLTQPLEHWAKAAPERIFLAERNSDDGWRTLTYAQVHLTVRHLAAGLLQRDLSPERPVVVLSGNGIDHALLGLAAMSIGVPYAPVSPAYSLLSSDFGKLRAIMALLTPGLVYAADGATFARAIDSAVPSGVELAVSRNPPAGRDATLFEALQAEPGPEVDAAQARQTPDSIAKFLFTSGSTGTPKAVINTQRMLCSNQAMLAAAFRFLADEPPVVVDWLPWSHTFGGNHNFNMVLTAGGTLYIDDGNPTPAGVGRTVRNLRDVAPTVYFNVPRGYEALLPYFRDDAKLRETFFSRLKVLFYAGAGLNHPTWDALQELSIATCGERVIFVSSLGSTETSPLALACTHDWPHPGNIGVPAPGVELKLVPAEGRLEARLRGPHITPGYWRQDDLTRAAFDKEGFYCIGDALKFANPNDPAQGLLFDGRLAENFKLATGTWVHVGPLRARILDHFGTCVRDVVIAGPDRDEIGALVFPDVEACRALCPDLPTDAPAGSVLASAGVRRHFAERLAELARHSPGSSTRVCRMLLLETPPSLDAGEITDKGSINQRAVLARRAALVEELYASSPSERVIALGA